MSHLERKIDLIGSLLLVNRKVEDLKDEFSRFYSLENQKAMQYPVVDDRHDELVKRWMTVISDRTEIEEELQALLNF